MPSSGDAKPYPKPAATKPGRPRRYRRFAAGPKQWAVLRQTKGGPCRVCGTADWNGVYERQMQLHHVVPRAAPWFGDDLADNLIPLCRRDHELVTRRDPITCNIVALQLTDAEYAYAIKRGGEGFFERAYGVEYQR